MGRPQEAHRNIGLAMALEPGNEMEEGSKPAMNAARASARMSAERRVRVITEGLSNKKDGISNTPELNNNTMT